MIDYRALLAAIGVAALILALWHGGGWERSNPDKLGFKWGYFVIYNTLLGNLYLSAVFLWAGVEDREGGLLLTGLLIAIACGTIAYFSVRRQKWALVLTTLTSFNLIWMLINFFYLRNRWSEFEGAGAGAVGMPLAVRFRTRPRDIRIALFVAISWAVCVPSYVFLFKPYGYMSDDEMTHMFTVVALPIAIGFGLFYLYRALFR